MQFEVFTKHWTRIYKQKVLEYENDQRSMNNLIKTSKTIQALINVWNLANDKLITLRQAIKELNLFNQKSKLYSFFRKIMKIMKVEEIYDLICKHTGPKEINYVYDEHIRSVMCDAHYVFYHNKTNVWLRFKKSLFPKLSLKTTCKIINADPRNPKQKKRAKVKHPLRYYNLPFGLIQMDLKIIGSKESPTGKRITIFDGKDEQSKLYYIEVLENASISNLLFATTNMIEYYQSLGMTITRIRTDNAKAFKKNTFVETFTYDELLRLCNILNEKIQIANPEQNGVIESQHRIVDAEFKCRITSDDTIKSLNEKAKDWMYKFNFERYHYYEFLSKCSDYKNVVDRYFIPYEFYKMHL